MSAGPHSTGSATRGTRLQSEIVRVAGSRQVSWRTDCMRQVRRANFSIGTRPKADVRDVAKRVNHFAGRKTVRSFRLSQSLVLPKCQIKRREPRRARGWSRGRSGTRRWGAERRRVSACVHHQVMWVYSCFREGRNDLGLSSSEYTPNAGPDGQYFLQTRDVNT